MTRFGAATLLALVAILVSAQDNGVKILKLRVVAIEQHDDPNPVTATSVDDKGTKLVLVTAHPVFKVTGEDSLNRLVLSCEWPESYTIPPSKTDAVVAG